MKPIDELKAIAVPECRADRYYVYFLFDGDELVYVGQSAQGFNSRLEAHRKDKEFDRVAVVCCEGRAEMCIEEFENIATHEPKYNLALTIPSGYGYISLASIRSHYHCTPQQWRKAVREGICSVYCDGRFGVWFTDTEAFKLMHVLRRRHEQ